MPVPKKKLPLLKLAAVVLVLLIGTVLLLRGVDLRGTIDSVMAAIRARGPAVFFIAYTILPACGFPVIPFVLAAGPAFSEQLGMPMVVTLSLTAITVNFLFSYWLARGALRPFLQKLLPRFGYAMPNVEAGDAVDLVVILRLTPGVPFVVQNYMAGLAGLPFGKYVLISCLIAWPYNVATLVFGDAVIKGKGGIAVAAGSLLVVVAMTTHLLRKRYARKTKPVT
jgi:uncharacterized membrane protein YdjX (TVP38/TMEM64 family)